LKQTMPDGLDDLVGGSFGGELALGLELVGGGGAHHKSALGRYALPARAGVWAARSAFHSAM